MGIVAHDLEESLPRARVVLLVGMSAQLIHVLSEQGDGFSGGIATSCPHLEVHVHRDKDQLDWLEVVVHGVAHAGVGL